MKVPALKSGEFWHVLVKKGMKLKAFERPLIIAHRGYRAKYPENTLAAFKAALDVGVQMIECDVLLTSDRRMVIMHDSTLERTTDGKGLVRNATLEELKKLDAGQWFHPRFRGERIPTLEEVLNVVAASACLNIEIKRHAYEDHGPPGGIEAQVVELLNRYKAMASVLISSFEPKILENFASMEQRPALGLLSKYPGYGDPLDFCTRVGAFSWHPNCMGLRRDQVEAAKRQGIRVFPYNVDTPEDFQQMMQFGVDGVITSDPLQACEP